MSQTPEGEDGFIIKCTNLCCASNGGDNYSEIEKRIERESHGRIKKGLEKLKQIKKILEMS